MKKNIIYITYIYIYSTEDALAVRYRLPLLNIPPKCDGCGGPFSLTHALDCRKGGLVGLRHNEVRDAFGDLLAKVFSQVVREPVVAAVGGGCAAGGAGEVAVATAPEGLRGDLFARGVFGRQEGAVFDIRVVDTDAPSYSHHTVSAVL